WRAQLRVHDAEPPSVPDRGDRGEAKPGDGHGSGRHEQDAQGRRGGRRGSPAAARRDASRARASEEGPGSMNGDSWLQQAAPAYCGTPVAAPPSAPGPLPPAMQPTPQGDCRDFLPPPAAPAPPVDPAVGGTPRALPADPYLDAALADLAAKKPGQEKPGQAKS